MIYCVAALFRAAAVCKQKETKHGLERDDRLDYTLA